MALYLTIEAEGDISNLTCANSKKFYRNKAISISPIFILLDRQALGMRAHNSVNRNRI